MENAPLHMWKAMQIENAHETFLKNLYETTFLKPRLKSEIHVTDGNSDKPAHFESSQQLRIFPRRKASIPWWLHLAEPNLAQPVVLSSHPQDGFFLQRDFTGKC